MVEEIAGIKIEVPQEILQVWLSIDLIERLIELSDSNTFETVHAIFDLPIKKLPEYLLLAVSQV
jgi:hypothetical protein